MEEMGDPISVGAELDRIHRPKPQWGLLTLTVLLALAGAVLRVVLTADWSAYLWILTRKGPRCPSCWDAGLFCWDIFG